MADHRYEPIGKCIYCPSDKLVASDTLFSDEHIIPLALGGNLILPNASCDECARIINSEIETPILQEEWGYFRIRRNFPTRSRKRRGNNRRTHIKLTRTNGSLLKIPISDYSSPVPMYLFSEARIFTDAPRIFDTGNGPQWDVKFYTDHDAELEMKKKYPEWSGVHRLKMRPFEFARMLAKIAYSYVAAEYGLGFFKPYVLDVIFGRSDDCFKFVGGKFDILDAIQDGDHITNISILFRSSFQAFLIVEIRLFSQIKSPAYHVVVGEIDLRNELQATAFEKFRQRGRIVDKTSNMSAGRN